VITGPEMSMATRDTHPAVMADSGSLLPGWALAPFSLLPRQPACRLQGGGPAGEHGRAQSCWNCSLWRTLNGPDRAAATPADTGAARPTDLEDAPDRRFRSTLYSADRLAGGMQIILFGVHSGYFADPDGHLWEIAWDSTG